MGRLVPAVTRAPDVLEPVIRRTEEREGELTGLAVGGAAALSGRLGHHEGQQ
ncbi:hypothetical protein [Streptomyces atratus]|uniref:hypothetical protein n=1 Tax=Streptomyces atratus TaxID=1893 RepID=UPI00224E1943|nr:hypothetical protein [Streptomyces atratus]MCX5339540.1 hypothetical protein [Streptomyces atratus]